MASAPHSEINEPRDAPRRCSSHSHSHSRLSHPARKKARAGRGRKRQGRPPRLDNVKGRTRTAPSAATPHPSSKLEYFHINKFSKTAISIVEEQLHTWSNLYRAHTAEKKTKFNYIVKQSTFYCTILDEKMLFMLEFRGYTRRVRGPADPTRMRVRFLRVRVRILRYLACEWTADGGCLLEAGITVLEGKKGGSPKLRVRPNPKTTHRVEFPRAVQAGPLERVRSWVHACVGRLRGNGRRQWSRESGLTRAFARASIDNPRHQASLLVHIERGKRRDGGSTARAYLALLCSDFQSSALPARLKPTPIPIPLSNCRANATQRTNHAVRLLLSAPAAGVNFASARIVLLSWLQFPPSNPKIQVSLQLPFVFDSKLKSNENFLVMSTTRSTRSES
ncbi:hypothetical protein B0H11DRAFT_2197366 [Mycena galericulata]|nr:hypothetical protein B0H11DRAFT_2197366 [Mycena galericulata]